MKIMKLFKQTHSVAILAVASLMLFSCSSDDDGPAPIAEVEPPIILECGFLEQGDHILMDNPNAPVDYIITCEAKVNGKLTVEAGVVIAFEPDASLRIFEDGSLQMIGTEAKPIVLTGIQPEKGIWRGMLIESNKASNVMNYVVIEYAGSSSASHSGGMYPAGLQVNGDADVTIDHCTFQHCKDNGLYWSSSKYISITNSVFTNNDVPMKTWGSNQIKLYNNTNTYTGNVNDYVDMQYPNISNDGQQISWKKIDVPYFITTRIYNRFDVDHAQLVIEPGVDIIFATAETHMRILDDASITAVGTESDPIIFRGKNDVQAAWRSIIVSSGSALNEIGHAKIKNAGNTMADIQAAVQVDYDSYLNIHDVSFTTNAGYAIGMLYTGGMPWPVLAYNNLTVDNGKVFCKGVNGTELSDPNDPDS